MYAKYRHWSYPRRHLFTSPRFQNDIPCQQYCYIRSPFSVLSHESLTRSVASVLFWSFGFGTVNLPLDLPNTEYLFEKKRKTVAVQTVHYSLVVTRIGEFLLRGSSWMPTGNPDFFGNRTDMKEYNSQSHRFRLQRKLLPYLPNYKTSPPPPPVLQDPPQ